MLILGILFGFVALCIIALILLQESKGGGIAAMGVPGMDNIIGARNPLRRLTIYFGIAFLLLMLGINMALSNKQGEIIQDDVLKKAPVAEVPGDDEFGVTATEELPVDGEDAASMAIPVNGDEAEAAAATAVDAEPVTTE